MTPESRPPRAKGRFWAAMPTLLLGSLIGTQLAVLAGVLDDPAFAVERDYYRKAVDWDAWREQRADNERLGWSADVTLTAVPAGARVDVALADRHGLALAGARVALEAFHNARSARVLEVALEETEPGRHRALLPARRPGLWELRLRVARGEETYTQVARRDLRNAP